MPGLKRVQMNSVSKKVVNFVTYKNNDHLRRQLNVCLRSLFRWSIVTDHRISNWRSSAFMYIKEEILSIYLSLDLIMKAEEPMVFYDDLIFSLVFSKLQGSSQNDNAQKRTGTNRKIGIMMIWMLFSIVKSYCFCCCELLGPQLFFDFTSGLKKNTCHPN